MKVVESYADFLETIPDGAIVVDQTGSIVMANKRAHRIFGYPENGLWGELVHILMPQELSSRHAAYVEHFFADPHPRPMARGLDFSARRRDDRLIAVDIMLNPILLEDNQYALAIIRDTTERRQMEERIRAELMQERIRAITDHLTELSNRRGFLSALQREIDRFYRYKSPFSIAYFDLDDFKAINDERGHCEGDKVLRTIARKGYTALRDTDVFARIGGDEFAILLPETGAEGAQAAITKFKNVVTAALDANDWPVTMSVGLLTCTELEVGFDAEKILYHADQAMYTSKRSGKSREYHRINPFKSST